MSRGAGGAVAVLSRDMSKQGDLVGGHPRGDGRERGLPHERDWERSALLEPRSAPRIPELISDGGGLAFAPAALAESSKKLDPADPAVDALLVQLGARAAPKRTLIARWRQGAAQPPPTTPSLGLDGWRLLARNDTEALFGRGLPPQLVTVAVRRDRRRGTWACIAQSAGRPLRATRDGIRASSWRLDPRHVPGPGDEVLRILLTEQTRSGGQRADGRLLAPDLHESEDELILTMFIAPQPGFQMAAPNPETPARIALPRPLGSRRLLDGALYDEIHEHA